MFISDFPDLLTSDGARKVVPVKLEPELKKKKKWERLGPNFVQSGSEKACNVGQAWAGHRIVARGCTQALGSPSG